MAITHTRGNGSLFTNKHKLKECHPDYTGQYKHYDGVEYQILGWAMKSKDDEVYLSLKFNRKGYKYIPK